MTDAVTASVVIVSRNRPDALRRCLAGVGQVCHPAFEIVVVADGAALAALPDGLRRRIKTAPCEVPNISAARNIGICLAAGEVVAFVDDDAVPEPTWLARLTAPFADPAVMSAGGHVRGRDGIALQWGGSLVDAQARRLPLAAGDGPLRIVQTPGRALKTEGTNMAFRRDALAALGGFDPAFPFYLDETDLNLRLAAAGAVAVLVPLAHVHHGFAASDRRRSDRVPRTLADVGASLAVFLRKHAGDADPARLAAERAERRRGLIGHMVAGRIEPRDVGRILATLDAGWQAGLARAVPPLPPLPPPAAPFLRWEGGAGPARVLTGLARDAARLRAMARDAAAAGERVTLVLLSCGTRPHRIGFDPAGYWLQRGGVLGRSRPGDPRLALWRAEPRLRREVALSATFRCPDDGQEGEGDPKTR